MALTIQTTLMYLLKLAFLKVETDVKIREKRPFANSERKVKTFKISGKMNHLLQQIHHKEKTWKTVVLSSLPKLLLVGFGPLLIPCYSPTDVYFKNTKKLSQSLTAHCYYFFFPEQMSMFSFKIRVYMHWKKKVGLSNVVRGQQQSSFFFGPMHQLARNDPGLKSIIVQKLL